MKKVLATLATASTIVAGSALYVPSAEAVTITLDGTKYDISMINGSFNDNQELLETQPWFGDQSLALEAASAVQFGLEAFRVGQGIEGYDPTFVFGPLFAYEVIQTSSAVGAAYYTWMEEVLFNLMEETVVLELGVVEQTRFSYAIANEVESHDVPEPLTILGTITFGGFIAGMKKRRSQQN